MDKQKEIERVAHTLIDSDLGCPDCEICLTSAKNIAEYLVDNGIGTKERFYGFTASGQKEIPQIKPIDYTI